MALTLSNGDIVAIANQFGGFYKDPNLDDPYQDNEWDAYRHAYTSAKYTEAFNATIAEILGDLKELDVIHTLPTDPSELSIYYSQKNMDKWNNNVGREEYQHWKEAIDAGITTDSLEKWIYDVVKQGKTINSLTDTRQWTYQPTVESVQNYLLDFGKDVLDFIITPAYGDENNLSLYDNRIIFGSKNTDALNGSDYADLLYGGDGNDTLLATAVMIT